MIDPAKLERVFFDVGGVCLTNGWDENSREEASQEFSYDFDESENIHNQNFEDFEKGLISRDEYLNRVIFFKDRPFSKQDFIQFMEAQSQPIESTFNLLEKLRKQNNYYLATINNESKELNQFRIKTFRLYSYFSAFFSSCFLHMRKPTDEIFYAVMNITNSKPEECLFIDDREENIERADEMGLQTMHAKNIEQLEEKLKKLNILK